MPVRTELDIPIELERLIRDPRMLGLLETELCLPVLGFEMLRRDVDLEGDMTFVTPSIDFLEVENLEV